jgi:hypothetical protein
VADISWLSQQAQMLHAMFENVFYGMALILLMLGIVSEYFKLPLGGMPQFGHLIGRLLIATILLTSYSEVSNVIADFTDALCDQLGSLNNIKLVLGQYWDKVNHLQISWISLKDSVLMIISFVTFFLLYISVYIADAAITYAWVLLYVFSPILTALYVLPATAGATKALYRSLFEVSAWKIVWSVLATLLWSAAMSQINNAGNQINFITAVSFNLILAASLLMTPFVVNALAGAGIASMAAQMAGTAAGAAAFSPGQLASNFMKKKFSKKPEYGSGGPDSASRFQQKFTSDADGPPSGPGKEAGMKSKPNGKFTEKTTSLVSSFAPNNGNAGQSKSSPSSSPTVKNEPTVSFKQAVRDFKAPPNRSEHQKQPVQRALFNESRQPKGDPSNKGSS